MSRVLLLGGTTEGRWLAQRLGADDIYSVAGLGRPAEGLACTQRQGGFGGVQGLARYLREARIDRLIDATHPYAAQISANAHAACRRLALPLWAVRRPPWRPERGDDWRMVAGWDDVVAALRPFRRPLFTLGREPLAHLAEVPAEQCWSVRCLSAHAAPERVRIVADRGPYTLASERRFFAEGRFDVLVSKNSGGAATAAKLQVARESGLPVIMLQRPLLPSADRCFDSAEALWEAWT